MIEGFISGTQYPRMNQSVYDRSPDVMRPEAIGRRLEIIREAYGLKKSEMADLLEIERTYWSRFEGGRRTIPMDIAYMLCEKFGVTLDYIILGRDNTLHFEIREKLAKTSRSLSG